MTNLQQRLQVAPTAPDPGGRRPFLYTGNSSGVGPSYRKGAFHGWLQVAPTEPDACTAILLYTGSTYGAIHVGF